MAWVAGKNPEKAARDPSSIAWMAGFIVVRQAKEGVIHAASLDEAFRLSAGHRDGAACDWWASMCVAHAVSMPAHRDRAIAEVTADLDALVAQDGWKTNGGMPRSMAILVAAASPASTDATLPARAGHHAGLIGGLCAMTGGASAEMYRIIDDAATAISSAGPDAVDQILRGLDAGVTDAVRRLGGIHPGGPASSTHLVHRLMLAGAGSCGPTGAEAIRSSARGAASRAGAQAVLALAARGAHLDDGDAWAFRYATADKGMNGLREGLASGEPKLFGRCVKDAAMLASVAAAADGLPADAPPGLRAAADEARTKALTFVSDVIGGSCGPAASDAGLRILAGGNAFSAGRTPS